MFKDDFLCIDERRRWEVTVLGEVKQLTRTEWNILYELCQNAGKAVSYEALICDRQDDSCECHYNDFMLLKTEELRWFIWRIRRKLRCDGAAPPIVTIQRFGYRYEPYFERD